MKVKRESEVTQSCLTQRSHGLQPTRLLRPWDFPGKSTGVGCHCLLSQEADGSKKKKKKKGGGAQRAKKEGEKKTEKNVRET